MINNKVFIDRLGSIVLRSIKSPKRLTKRPNRLGDLINI